MALVGQAMVMVVARALREQTWAGDRVFEQPVNPLPMVLQGNPRVGQPAIAVYVEQVEGDPRQLETQRGAQKVGLKVVVYAPPKVKVESDGETLAFDADGAGLVLNLMQRQVLSALQHGNGPWVGLFRQLTTKSTSRKSRFLLIEFEDGVRLPSAELAIDVEAIPEPDFGRGLYGPWVSLDGLLRDDGQSAVADLLKNAIEQPNDLPEWALLQAQNNLTDAAYRAIGLAPLAVTEEGAAPALSAVEIPTDIEVVPPQVP